MMFRASSPAASSRCKYGVCENVAGGADMGPGGGAIPFNDVDPLTGSGMYCCCIR